MGGEIVVNGGEMGYLVEVGVDVVIRDEGERGWFVNGGGMLVVFVEYGEG